MGLQIDRVRTVRGKLTLTLIAVFALVAQPLYGMVETEVARAIRPQVSSFVFDEESAIMVNANEMSAALRVNTNSHVGGNVVLEVESSSETGRFAFNSVGNFSDSNVATSTFTSNHATKAFYYKDATPGSVEITATLRDGNDNNGNNQAVFTTTHTVLVGSNDIASISPEEFVTNDDRYKGISVGFTAKNLKDVTDVTVTLHRDGSDSIVKTAAQGVIDLLNDDGEEQLTTPFFVQEGELKEADDAAFWNAVENDVWTPESIPTSAEIVITHDGGKEVRVTRDGPLTEANGVTYASLLPAEPQEVDPLEKNVLRVSGSLYRDLALNDCDNKSQCENRTSDMFAGWTVNLYKLSDSNTWDFVQSSVSNESGAYGLGSHQTAGTYFICAEPGFGWTQSEQLWDGSGYRVATVNLSGNDKEGSHCAEVVYTDEGDKSFSSKLGFADISAPIIHSVTPSDGDAVSGNVTISVRAQDASGVEKIALYVGNAAGEKVKEVQLQQDTDDDQLWTTSLDTAVFEDGKYQLSLRAVALDGTNKVKYYNNRKDSHEVLFDNTKPVISVKSESAGTNGVFSKISLKLYDKFNIDKIYVNGVEKNLSNNTWGDLNDIIAGKYGAVAGENTVTLVDVAGNKKDFTFMIDTEAPTATVSYSNSNGNAVTKDDVTVTLTATEPIENITGWERVADNILKKVHSENGKHSVEIVDYAQNKTVVKYEVKRIDRILPVINGIDNGAKYTRSVAYTITEQSIQSIVVNGQAYTERSAPYTFSDDGSYTLTVTDKAGNTTTVSFSIDQTTPVIVTPVLLADGTAAEGAFLKGEHTFVVKQDTHANPGEIYVEFMKKNQNGDWKKMHGKGYKGVNEARFTVNTTQWGDGERLVKISTKDTFGNKSGYSFIVTADKTKPQLTAALSETMLDAESEAPKLTVKATDANAIKTVQYKVMQNGENVRNFSWVDVTNDSTTTVERLLELEDGTYTLRTRAFDVAGNKQSGVDISFVIDNSPALAGNYFTLLEDQYSVGFTVNRFKDAQSVTVDLLDGEEVIATNTGDSVFMKNLLNKKGEISSPFYADSTVENDEYWQFGATDWTGVAEPTAAKVTVVYGDGQSLSDTISLTAGDFAYSHNDFVALYVQSASNDNTTGGDTPDDTTADTSRGTERGSGTNGVTPLRLTPIIGGPAAAVFAQAPTQFFNLADEANEEDADEAVLSTTDASDDQTSPASGVASATDEADAANGFALAWYWWLLIVAAVGAGLWWLVAALRRDHARDAYFQK